MERKTVSSTEVVAVEQMKVRLGRTGTVSAEEERVLRMRHGVGSDLHAPLPRAAGNNVELGDELLLMEMQLMRAARARSAPQVVAPATQVVASPTKAKIVRALRKKK